MKTPSWIVGPAVATAVLEILGFQFGFFASGGGLLLAAGGALWAGAGVASIIDARRRWRNALVIAVWIVAMTSGFLAWAQHVSNAAPPGAHGGPNVYRPGVTRESGQPP